MEKRIFVAAAILVLAVGGTAAASDHRQVTADDDELLKPTHEGSGDELLDYTPPPPLLKPTHEGSGDELLDSTPPPSQPTHDGSGDDPIFIVMTNIAELLDAIRAGTNEHNVSIPLKALVTNVRAHVIGQSNNSSSSSRGEHMTTLALLIMLGIGIIFTGVYMFRRECVSLRRTQRTIRHHRTPSPPRVSYSAAATADDGV